MNQTELKNILNTFPNAKQSSKDTVLQFFNNYHDFTPPKFWVNKGIIYVVWNYFEDGSKIAMGFDDGRITYTYTLESGKVEEGVYPVQELLLKLSKPLLTVDYEYERN